MASRTSCCLYSDERPRAVIVGWDTLEATTKRHEMFPAYQSGREFDDDLIEQLNVLPDLVTAFGFANAKAPRYEAKLAELYGGTVELTPSRLGGLKAAVSLPAPI